MLICSYDEKWQNNCEVTGVELEGNIQALLVPCNRNGIVHLIKYFKILFFFLIVKNDRLHSGQAAIAYSKITHY